jgi:P27 family predicted phage terminase small subunit
MASPRPKPRSLKILEGNPGKRHLKNEPQPENALLVCPWWLKKDRVAFNEWNRVVPELYKLGLLTKIDQSILEVYCSQYAIYRESIRLLSKEGLTTINAREGIKANPHSAIAREAAKIIKAVAIEFGFTPSSRGRISMPQESLDDELRKLVD